MLNHFVRWTLAVGTSLALLAASTGCVVYGGRGGGYYRGHPHGGPPGHTGVHPGRGHGRGRGR